MISTRTGSAKTPDVLHDAETSLLHATDADAVLWCGRGATALFWALRATVASGGTASGQPEVLLPANICESVGSAAVLAGFVPRFADVDPDSGLLSLESARARLTANTRALVFAHLYGQTTDQTELVAWCRAHGIVLIEDAAHALGGHFPDGSPVGSIGAMTIYSFNRTKIIECGGGALVVRDHALSGALEALLQTESAYSEIDAARLALIEKGVRDLEHGMTQLFRSGYGEAVRGLFSKTATTLRDVYVRPMLEPAVVAAAWPSIAGVAERRIEKARRYADVFAGGPLQMLSAWQDSGVSWRFSVLADFPDQLGNFVSAIRQKGALVSNLYWPLADFFRAEDTCPNAEEFGRRVINLCVDDTVDLDWVTQRAREMLVVARSYSEAGRTV